MSSKYKEPSSLHPSAIDSTVQKNLIQAFTTTRQAQNLSHNDEAVQSAAFWKRIRKVMALRGSDKEAAEWQDIWQQLHSKLLLGIERARRQKRTDGSWLKQINSQLLVALLGALDDEQLSFVEGCMAGVDERVVDDDDDDDLMLCALVYRKASNNRYVTRCHHCSAKFDQAGDLFRHIRRCYRKSGVKTAASTDEDDEPLAKVGRFEFTAVPSESGGDRESDDDQEFDSDMLESKDTPKSGFKGFGKRTKAIKFESSSVGCDQEADEDDDFDPEMEPSTISVTNPTAGTSYATADPVGLIDTVGPVANPRIACDSGCQNGELKKTVAKLTLTVKHLDKNMAVISDALQKLSAKVVIQTISIIEPNADIVLPDLPLKSVAEVCDLNCRLLDMKFHDQMILRMKPLERTGTLNVKIRTLMESLLTYNCAIKYTWSGKTFSTTDTPDSRSSFNKMNGIVGFIVKLLQYRNLADVITEHDVKICMMDFFKRAKDRCKKGDSPYYMVSSPCN